MSAESEQRTLENLEAISTRGTWAERLAKIKTAEALRGHPITADIEDERTPERNQP